MPFLLRLQVLIGLQFFVLCFLFKDADCCTGCICVIDVLQQFV